MRMLTIITFRILLPIFFGLNFFVFHALAQSSVSDSGNPKGIVLKGKVPVNKEPIRIKFPKTHEATLPNGLRIVLLENHKSPTFLMQMVILSGGLSDPPDQTGIAYLTAALLREGTEKRTGKEISEQLDSLGVTFLANSSFSSSTSNVTSAGMVKNLDETLIIFSDVVHNAKFPKNEIEKTKIRLIQQSQNQRLMPRFQGFQKLYSSVYGKHPAGVFVPAIDSLERINSGDLARYHAAHYRPNNAILFIIGDTTLNKILPSIKRAFGDLEKGEIMKTPLPVVSELVKTQIHLIDRPKSPQTFLFFGNLGIERTGSDYFPLTVMNGMLGYSSVSRLQQNLREDKGYTYNAGSELTFSPRIQGLFYANSAVMTAVTAEAVREFLNEFKRIRDEKVPEKELDDAKREIIGGFAVSLIDPQMLLQYVRDQKLYNLPANYWDTYTQKIAEVTPEEVQRVARKYIDLEHMQIVAVGDAAKIKSTLEKYGIVTVF